MIPSANRRLATLMLIAIGLFIWWLLPHRTVVRGRLNSAAAFSTGMDQNVNGHVLHSEFAPLASFRVPPALKSPSALQVLPLKKTFDRCRKIVQYISGPEARMLRGIALRRLQGSVRATQWQVAAPARCSKALADWLRNPKYAALAAVAFSPRRSERAAAVDILEAVPGQCSTWLLDAMILDSSRYVRLRAMNAFWTRRPDSFAVKELFWMATGAGYAEYDLADAGRNWQIATAQPAPCVELYYRGKIVTSYSDVPRTISLTDQRRAAQILLHWHPASLGDLLVNALRHGVSPNSDVGLFDHELSAESPFVQNWSNYRNLFLAIRPPAAAAYLLGILNNPGSAMILTPIQGRQYYANNQTEPLFLLLADEHLNSTHFGLVTVAQGTGHAPRVVRCLYEGQQAESIIQVREWCRKHGVRAAHVPAGSARTWNSPPEARVQATEHLPKLPDLRCGVIAWYRWALRLPPDVQTAMLHWGLRTDHIGSVALAFSGKGIDRMSGAYLIQRCGGPLAQRVLAHLINDPAGAVRLAAMSVFWKRQPDATAIYALWRRAVTREFPAWFRREADSPLTWTLNFHNRRLVVYKHIPGVSPNESGTVFPTDSRAATDIVLHWHAAGIQGRLLDAVKALAQSDTGPLARAQGPDGLVGQNIIKLCRVYADRGFVPYLLADLNIKPYGGWTFGPYNGKTGYADERTDPLVILCNLTYKKPDVFGLHRFPAPQLVWDSYTAADLTVGIAAMKKFWAARGIHPPEMNSPAPPK